MSKITESVGDKIRSLRKERGLSQESLALKAGLNTSYMGQIERAEKSATIDSLEKIANALDVPIEELFSFERVEAHNVDKTIIDKVAFQLHGRTEMEQEAVYNFIKQLLWFRDKK